MPDKPWVSQHFETFRIEKMKQSEKEQSSPPSEPIIRHSPPQKRPHSPAPTINPTANKKIKVEQSLNQPKKKPQQSVIKNENPSKTTVNTTTNKKIPLTSSTKQSSIAEEKPTKHLPIKDANSTVSSTSNINGSTDDSSISKARPSSKLKPDHDSKPSTQSSTTSHIKKKEPIPSPSKNNTQIPIKKPIQIPTNKTSQKPSIKIEQTSTNKSPSNINIKRESSPNVTSSNSTTSTVSISSLKKIPKKVAPPPPPPPPPIVGKRVRSPMTPPPSNKSSDRDSHRHPSSSSKSQTSSKRDHPTTTTTLSSSKNPDRHHQLPPSQPYPDSRQQPIKNQPKNYNHDDDNRNPYTNNRSNGYDNDYHYRSQTPIDDDQTEQQLPHSSYRRPLKSSSTQRDYDDDNRHA
ncbi:unnamed protein product [Rotaria sp. Silwood1]|nr:unnamed protein product [Rotaria sp. Silwood1]